MNEGLTERFEMRLSKKDKAKINILCSYLECRYKVDLIRYLVNKEIIRTALGEGVEDAGK